MDRHNFRETHEPDRLLILAVLANERQSFSFEILTREKVNVKPKQREIPRRRDVLQRRARLLDVALRQCDLAFFSPESICRFRQRYEPTLGDLLRFRVMSQHPV